MEMEQGSTLQLQAVISPFTATNQNVTWSSSDTSVVSVDANGLMTAVAQGEATITVTTLDGGFTDQLTVTITVTPQRQADPGVKYVGQAVVAYPNPVTGSAVNLLLRGYADERVQVSLIDATGRQLWVRSLSVTSNEFVNKLSTADLSAGVYHLYVQGEQGRKHVRLMLTR